MTRLKVKTPRLTVEEAKAEVARWLEREEAFLILMGAGVGAVVAVGWAAAPTWVLWLVVVSAFISFVCFGQRARANQHVELAIEERDEYREERWQELNAEKLIELTDTLKELRQELATRPPHVH